MRFMNEYDIQMAARRHADNPIAMAAITQVAIVKQWADRNSDGWAYWPKPVRACAKLMDLIEGNGTNQAIQDIGQRATEANFKKAMAPVKAFRTRQGADFTIVSI